MHVLKKVNVQSLQDIGPQELEFEIAEQIDDFHLNVPQTQFITIQ